MTPRHHTCIVLAAIAATGISAAQPVATSPVLFSSTNDFVPAMFAADGKSKLLFAAVEPDGSANIEIQDGDLRPCRDSSIAAHPEAATSVTTRNRKFTMPDGTRLLERKAKYLSCYVCDTATGGRYNILYRIDTQGDSGIQQTGAPRKARVYPTAVTAGDNIRIEAQGGKASFLIHDTNGNRLYSGSTQDGEAPATVPASALSKGLNIVTVSTPGAEAESTKVIVR